MSENIERLMRTKLEAKYPAKAGQTIGVLINQWWNDLEFVRKRHRLGHRAYWTGFDLGHVISSAGTQYATTPDAASLDITADLGVVVKCALTDWTPTVQAQLVSKYLTTGDERTFRFTVEATTGYLGLRHSDDGEFAAEHTMLSTVAPTVSDGNDLYVGFTLDTDNGAGGHDAKFWTSPDGVVWTQLGATVTHGAVASIYNGPADVYTGKYEDGGVLGDGGTIHLAQIFDGIGANTAPNQGTKLTEYDAELASAGSPHDDGYGHTWTTTGGSFG